MSISVPQPKVHGGRDVIRASYAFPHLIYSAKIYPIAAPNGSTVIVYGHANGIRVVWKGGKPFKPLPPETPAHAVAPKPQQSTVIVLDSDDDEPPAKVEPPIADPGFEDEDDDDDDEASRQSRSRKIVQHLDLTLGTDVFHLCFPVSISEDALQIGGLPQILSEQMVVAAACSDHSLRVIVLPLMPPSPLKKRAEAKGMLGKLACPGDGTWGEQVLTLAGHHEIPTSISTTFTPKLSLSATNGGEDRNPDAALANEKTKEWDLLVASTSSEASGILIIHRLPSALTSTCLTLSTHHSAPVQAQCLSCPAAIVAFNPSNYASKRHTCLLLADSGGCVRLYDCCSASSQPTTYAPAQASPNSQMTAAGSGTWLLTLRLGFENVRLRETQGTERATDYGSKSKEFLDAKWILGGKAIIALLTNGEWGVWDVEGVAPAVKGSEHLAGLRPRTGIRGGARTTWTLSGRIDKIQTAPQLLDKARQENGASLAFAPRTPRTRRSEEQLLFSGSSIGSRDRARGCIAVQPISKISSKPASSETVLFWYENTISVIPDMRSFWKYQLAKSIAAEEDHIPRLDGKGEMVHAEAAAVKKEIICDVDLFPVPAGASSGAAKRTSTGSGLWSDVLLSSGHHLVVMSGRQRKQPGGMEGAPESQTNGYPTASKLPNLLGLNEINEQLTLLDRATDGERRAMAGERKRVGFAEGS